MLSSVSSQEDLTRPLVATEQTRTPAERRQPGVSSYVRFFDLYGALATFLAMGVQGAEGGLVVDNEGLNNLNGPYIAVRVAMGVIIISGATMGKYNLLRQFNTDDFKSSGVNLENLVKGQLRPAEYFCIEKPNSVDRVGILLGSFAQAIGFGGLTIIGLANPEGKGFAEYLYSYHFKYIDWLGDIAASRATRIAFALLSGHINYKGFPGIWNYAFKPELARWSGIYHSLSSRHYAYCMRRAQHPFLARLKLLRLMMEKAPWHVSERFLDELDQWVPPAALKGFSISDVTIPYRHRWGETAAAIGGMGISAFGFYNFYSLGGAIVNAILWTFTSLPYDSNSLAREMAGYMVGGLLFAGMMLMSLGVAPDASRTLYRYLFGYEQNITTLSAPELRKLKFKVGLLMLGAGLPVAFQASFVHEKVWLWFVAAMAAVIMEMKPTFERMREDASVRTAGARVQEINQTITIMNASSPLEQAIEPMNEALLKRARDKATELLTSASETNPARIEAASAFYRGSVHTSASVPVTPVTPSSAPPKV